MSQMRTPEEMQQFYDEREASSESGQPYTLDYEIGDSKLVFFGAKHTSEQDSEQWMQLEKQWDNFIAHGNPNKVLIFEKADAGYDDLSKEEMIAKHGESGYAVWLAKQKGVDIESPEQDRIKEIEFLKTKGHAEESIMTYYFGRQMHQWARQDKDLEPDWQKYAKDTVGKYNSLGCWSTQLSLDKVLKWFKQSQGTQLDVDDIKQLYDVSDPSQNPVSADSGAYRDIALKEAIEDKVEQGKDVFIVYGSGHAIRLEPMLDELFGKRVSNV